MRDKVRLPARGAVRKFKDIPYPELTNFLVNDLFKTNYPTIVCVDYTSEKAFSERLEEVLNPAFLAVGTPYYKKWRIVDPIVFTQDKKLEMKQNARMFLDAENPLFIFPDPNYTDPRTQALITETQEQLLRESGGPSQSGKWSFPKPEGFDNDLAMAFELMLLGAKKFYRLQNSIAQKPIAAGGRQYKEEMATPEERLQKQFLNQWQKRPAFENSDIKFDFQQS